jgi:Fe2+ transport system protein FeoA
LLEETILTLERGSEDQEYIITELQAEEEGMKEFLFSLGCFPGQKIKIVSKLASTFVIHLRDSRYSINAELASAINVQEFEVSQSTDQKRQVS